MARILGLFPSSLIAARSGMSANQFYRELRNVGMAARRTEVLQLYKVARSIVARSPDEPFRDITTAPTDEHLSAFPTKRATGIRQTVAITYRDRTTGHIQQTWWSTINETPLTREEAIATAIDAYSEHAEQYNQELIGAIHTSAYRLVPYAA
jgi:hypothetical protein